LGFETSIGRIAADAADPTIMRNEAQRQRTDARKGLLFMDDPMAPASGVPILGFVAAGDPPAPRGDSTEIRLEKSAHIPNNV
jgi:hypothetical protein